MQLMLFLVSDLRRAWFCRLLLTLLSCGWLISLSSSALLLIVECVRFIGAHVVSPTTGRRLRGECVTSVRAWDTQKTLLPTSNLETYSRW